MNRIRKFFKTRTTPIALTLVGLVCTACGYTWADVPSGNQGGTGGSHTGNNNNSNNNDVPTACSASSPNTQRFDFTWSDPQTGCGVSGNFSSLNSRSIQTFYASSLDAARSCAAMAHPGYTPVALADMQYFTMKIECPSPTGDGPLCRELFSMPALDRDDAERCAHAINGFQCDVTFDQRCN